ncbi:MAG: hypothetical protein IT539_04495 [Bradyrhizobiaceae bacterium]|nr:hypothetical protein [Bradyrhizobiaceae bacterium]
MLAFFCAALAAYAREQIGAGTRWALTPLTRHLPWNFTGWSGSRAADALRSEFTFVQIFLLDPAGRSARYEKTTSFVARRTVTSYQEAVTAVGSVATFSTMRGTIAETLREHGFHVSKIDLGNPVRAGERFTNVYSASLLDSFTSTHEHWTQEFAFPTRHLTFHIHFPVLRPPKSVSCKVIEGTSEKLATSNARFVDLFGRRSIVWEINDPSPNQVLKLEWIW